MRVLFTGATGAIGEKAVPLLVEQGHEVRGVARSEENRIRLAEMGADPVRADLFDRDSIDTATRDVDAIVHFATSIPPQAAMMRRRAWEMNDRLRTEATANLVDAAIRNGVSRFVQESVTFLYADGGERWLDEDSPVEPVWSVLDSAVAAEAEVGRFTRSGGDGVVLRLSRLYGPGRVSDEYVEAVRKRKMPHIGDGRNHVSNLHIDDAATAVVHALDVAAGTYNVTDDVPSRAGEALDGLAELLDAPTPRRIPAPVAGIALGKAAGLLTVSQRVSNERFKSASGWAPSYPSQIDGWREMVGVGARP